jgi:Stealth protein CR2, conserved region 2
VNADDLRDPPPNYRYIAGGSEALAQQERGRAAIAPASEESAPPLDIVYLFRHSKQGDKEILYSLRSVAKHAPYVRKVWVLGDRPEWLVEDKAIVEHVPHEYLAPLVGFKTPVRSDFLMLLLASLIPGLAFDFLRFSDDYILLQPLPRQKLCTVRALEDLNQKTNRGSGKWKAMLWNTFDILKRYGYAGYNFETHVPQPYTRQLVFEAYMAFRGFLTEERHVGMHAPTAIYNYGLKHQDLRFVWLAEEQSKVGLYGSGAAGSSAEDIAAACEGKLLLNYDDAAFGPPLLRFLQQKFPERCQFERV